MPSEEFKKAYQVLSAKCSRKEITTNEALKFAIKFKLKLIEKNRLINELKKSKFIDHKRYAKAFVNDRFQFYKWGKLKIKYQLIQKGIEEHLIELALNDIDNKEYYNLITQEAKKKYATLEKEDDYNTKQKLCKYLNQKGFEGELVFEVVDSLEI
tara:strand:- start:29551 stop:30015 length:465 start_codon:yes stop_codon:yes gene_type:complete